MATRRGLICRFFWLGVVNQQMGVCLYVATIKKAGRFGDIKGDMRQPEKKKAFEIKGLVRICGGAGVRKFDIFWDCLIQKIFV